MPCRRAGDATTDDEGSDAMKNEVWVLGAPDRTGRVIAKHLDEVGVSLVLAGRDRERLEGVVAALGGAPQPLAGSPGSIPSPNSLGMPRPWWSTPSARSRPPPSKLYGRALMERTPSTERTSFRPSRGPWISTGRPPPPTECPSPARASASSRPRARRRACAKGNHRRRNYASMRSQRYDGPHDRPHDRPRSDCDRESARGAQRPSDRAGGTENV